MRNGLEFQEEGVITNIDEILGTFNLSEPIKFQGSKIKEIVAELRENKKILYMVIQFILKGDCNSLRGKGYEI